MTNFAIVFTISWMTTTTSAKLERNIAQQNDN